MKKLTISILVALTIAILPTLGFAGQCKTPSQNATPYDAEFCGCMTPAMEANCKLQPNYNRCSGAQIKSSISLVFGNNYQAVCNRSYHPNVGSAECVTDIKYWVEHCPV